MTYGISLLARAARLAAQRDPFTSAKLAESIRDRSVCVPSVFRRNRHSRRCFQPTGRRRGVQEKKDWRSELHVSNVKQDAASDEKKTPPTVTCSAPNVLSHYSGMRN